MESPEFTVLRGFLVCKRVHRLPNAGRERAARGDEQAQQADLHPLKQRERTVGRT
jgi:hypothetical protein